MKKQLFKLEVLCIGLLVFLANTSLFASNAPIEIYTPNTRVAVAPGTTINYKLDIINNGNQTYNENINIYRVPKNWSYSLTSSGLNVSKLAVRPEDKKTLDFKLEIPYEVKKGYYTVYASMGEHASLPITIHVTTAGTNESELTCDQKNMEGTPKSNFTFSAILKNKTSSTQQYALMASPPKGWSVAIKPNYKQATSTEVSANGTKNITFDVKAASFTKAGKYVIPVKAVSGNSTSEMNLEVVITGTYDLSLSTPNGLLSQEITAGDEKRIELIVKNTGSTKLENIKLSDSKPKDWEVKFSKNTIEFLEAGATEKVFAHVKANGKAIPGDYMTTITAKTPETSVSTSFRMTVKTRVFMGVMGLSIILSAMGGMVYLTKKYGRR
ncbi:hypothetical protein KMW28_03430 [Flammeovirga yaeyamensis]|uniref:Alpha-galactosidase NEW3 domain-containing protein n=1 Tax=Flammeovirga yaeyamensis TaxID=367791 RepID=A0AAX1N512_9BACT|nr:NEW3 domain-containing protein [Flammeovirga yaeyamensis]MBB3701303.1 putative membrane protein [Flammeovirga yaeyamensis]NMF38228.1 hypothetical protein [Flammeovirga yaeyamensis]QWG02639.1 hypothetical protein KMW28_03430 [Flammeovirga yaeyamensis]